MVKVFDGQDGRVLRTMPPRNVVVTPMNLHRCHKSLTSVVNIVRFLGMLPIVQEGEDFYPCLNFRCQFTFRKLLVLAYDISLYIFYMACVVFVRDKLLVVQKISFLELSLKFLIMLSVVSVILVPYKYWCKSGGICSYLQKIRLFEIAYHQLTGRVVPTITHRWSATVLTLWWFVDILCAFLNIEGFNSRFSLIAFLSTVHNLVVCGGTILWLAMCGTVTHFAIHLSKSYKASVEEPASGTTRLDEYRKLWSRLRSLLVETGDVLAFNYVFHLLTLLSFTSILSFYAIYNVMIHDVNMRICSSLVLFSCSMFAMINAAHVAMEKVNSELIQQLLMLRARTTNIAIKYQIGQFLATVVNHPSTLNLGGYISLNRELFTALCGMLISNGVILLQFHGAPTSDATVTNNDTLHR